MAYCADVDIATGDPFQVELSVDLLQLQGLEGVTFWTAGGGPGDPRP